VIPPYKGYRALRVYRNIYALTSPRRAVRRAKNILVAKALGKLGFWAAMRRLWRR
jgi:hypothetical protein